MVNQIICRSKPGRQAAESTRHWHVPYCQRGNGRHLWFRNLHLQQHDGQPDYQGGGESGLWGTERQLPEWGFEQGARGHLAGCSEHVLL